MNSYFEPHSSLNKKKKPLKIYENEWMNEWVKDRKNERKKRKKEIRNTDRKKEIDK